VIAFYDETASSALSSFTITASTSYFSNTRVFRLHTNVRTGEKFCNNCAATVYPSFMPYFVYTQEDIEFLLAVGIDPKRIKPNDFGIRKNQIPVP
jgi:hypothetical protein